MLPGGLAVDQNLQNAAAQFFIIICRRQAAGLSVGNGIDNAASGKGRRGQAVGSGFNGHHAEAFGVIGNMAHGENMNIGQDRKSTRLNSSHVAISYAVFCLKKKKKKTKNARLT